MYANVVVGVDGRAGGRDAAALAPMLAVPRAAVTLVYVDSTAAVGGRPRHGDHELAGDDSLEALLVEERELCGSEAQLRRVTADSVGAGLEGVGAELGADLIIVGAAHRHGLARVIGGDDTESVVHRTPRAVAVAPAGYAGHLRVPVRIGVAVDGTPQSEVAVAHAGLLAAQRNSLLTLRHVVEPHYYSAGWAGSVVPVDDPEIELAAAREVLPDVDGLPVEHVFGPVGETLAAFGGEVDLLVSGSRRNGATKRIVLGSTSEYLARHVTAPLLIAPPVDPATVERWRARPLTAAV